MLTKVSQARQEVCQVFYEESLRLSPGNLWLAISCFRKISSLNSRILGKFWRNCRFCMKIDSCISDFKKHDFYGYYSLIKGLGADVFSMR